MEELRESENILVFGAPGCGKTTFAKEFMEGKPGLFFTKALRDRGLVGVPEIESEEVASINNKNCFYRIKPPVPPAKWNKALMDVYNQYVNGCVYYDDIGTMASGNLTGSLIDIIGGVRHNCNDQIFSFWNPNDCAPFIYQMATRIVIFKTGKVELRNREKYPRLEEFEAAMDWVEGQEYKHCYAYFVTDPLNEDSKKPFQKFLNIRK
jgi:hypothetical protein